MENTPKRKALITGIAGFIGSNLADRLIAEGWEVTGIDNLSTGKRENVNPAAKFVEEDIVKCDFAALGHHDVVFHLAALARIQPSIEDPATAHAVNAYGSIRVFMAAVSWNARVVFSSSSSVYGDAEHLPVSENEQPSPASPYALQKLVCEQYLKLFAELYGLEAIALRYFNVTGPRQILEGAYAAVGGIFLNQYEKGQPFTIVGDGEQRRDFTFVADVVDANVKAALVPRKGEPAFEVVNIGTERNLSVNDLANAIDKEHPREFLAERKGEAKETLANIEKAVHMLQWKPTVRVDEWMTQEAEKIRASRKPV